MRGWIGVVDDHGAAELGGIIVPAAGLYLCVLGFKQENAGHLHAGIGGGEGLGLSPADDRGFFFDEHHLREGVTDQREQGDYDEYEDEHETAARGGRLQIANCKLQIANWGF